MYAIDQSSSPVFPSWTTSPFTYVRNAMSSGSTSATSASTGPIGQNPSWPFTRSIEPRSAWRKSWTPKSFAGAKPST